MTHRPISLQKLAADPTFAALAIDGGTTEELRAVAATLGTCSDVTLRRARRLARGESVNLSPRAKTGPRKPVEAREAVAPVIAPVRDSKPATAPRGFVSRIVDRVKATIAPKPEHETWLVLFDPHAPFHDAVLWEKTCRLASDFGRDLTGVVLGGDFLDMASLSGHSADSLRQLRLTTLTDEYRVGSSLLDDLDSAIPADARKEYLYGNHEDRYWRELDKGDRGKYGSELTSPTVGLSLVERGYSVQENWKEAAVTLGDHLEVMHGVYCPVHSAKKHLDEFMGSCMFGHTHRQQTFYLGKRAAFNVGGLFDLNSPAFHYMARPQRMKWSQGLAIVRIDSARDYHVEQPHVHNGTFYAAGRFY
jgi:hypothetical protein